MVAVPAAIAVTNPPDETVATEVSDVAHAMVGFEMMFPAPSLTVVTRVVVSPADVKLTFVGARVIEAAV